MNKVLINTVLLFWLLSLLVVPANAEAQRVDFRLSQPYQNLNPLELPTMILPDEEFNRAVSEGEMQAFFDTQPGVIKDYTFSNGQYEVDAVTAIAYHGEFTGVNPQVLAALLELSRGALSNDDMPPSALALAFGRTEAAYRGFQYQLGWAVEELAGGFEDWQTGAAQAEIVLKDGTRYEIPASTNAATYSLLRFMSLIAEPEEWQAWVQQRRFQSVYASLFGAQALEPQQAASPAQMMMAPTDMRLPFGNGEAWYYTGGPHSTNRAAVDFAPGGGSGCSWTSNSAVRAVKAGTVIEASCDRVRIRHDDGWVTSYFHLRDIQVKNKLNQRIEAGTIVGYPSCNTGASCGWSGTSTGVHLHFSVLTGSLVGQRINGAQLGGWTINELAGDYRGTMTQGGVTKTASTTKSANNELRAYETNVDTDDGRTLSSGSTVTGTRTPGTDEDIYYVQANSGQQMTVEMWQNSSSLDSFVYVRDPNNMIIGSNDDSNGTLNSRLSLTLNSNGRYTVVAKGFSTSTGGYNLRVTLGSGAQPSSNWLQHNQTLTASLASNAEEDTYYFNGVQGRITSLRMWANNSSVDTYLELYSPNGTRIATNDDDSTAGNRNSWIAITLPSSGVYRVKARSYAHASSGGYQIRLRWVEAANLAQGRPAYASTVESSSYRANYATDGNINTRWSSQFRNDQSIQIDLGSTQTVNMVILRWETAYARRYGIYTWDGSRWVNVFWTDNGRGGTEIINFANKNTRYVLMYASTRATSWGVSLWEFGVYNRAMATAPLITEDPEKIPDDILPVTPPAATGPGKDELEIALSMGENGYQEFAPEPGTFDGSGEDLALAQAGKPTALIDSVTWDDEVVMTGATEIIFSGSASDNDADGASPEIVQYEWVSDRDGVIGTQAEFTLAALHLSSGTHTISFRARDNDGVWSDADTLIITLQIAADEKIYLPMVIQ